MQIVGGVITTAGGVTGELLGGAASVTGLGAAVGVPALVVSTGLVVGGVGNIAAGIQGLSQSLMSTGARTSGARERSGDEYTAEAGDRKGSSGYREKTRGANRNDRSMVDAAARQAGIQDRADFGKFIHETKSATGRGGSQNFTSEELLDLAEEFRSSGGR